MAWKIQVLRAKPNPAGKDRVFGVPRQEQLLGEWVDLKNIGDQSVSLAVLGLANRTFNSRCEIVKEAQLYWQGNAQQSLAPGQIVRVHTGKSIYSASMNQVDRAGVHFHAYADQGNFVLNNRCGDLISVWWQGSDGKWNLEDQASYDPEPPEGDVLVRQGPVLVPSAYAVL